MYELRKLYKDQVDFTYINISHPDGRSQAQARGLRLGTPQLIFHDSSGKVADRWVGQVTQADVEPAFVSVLK